MTSHQEELMTSHQTLARLSERLLEDVHALYRTLRAAPEPSMQEHWTAALIQQRMEDLGYQAVLCGGTGVVAVLRNGAEPVVAFRADIDALPVQEETGLSYASSARGRLPDGTEVPVMHACGHDAHIACAVGAATLLAQQRDDWSGTVVFVFQPGEETSQGARVMVQDGLWDRTPAPQVIFGQHVWPGVAGTVEVSSGPAMAMADSWKVTVHGRGGHRSQPEDTVDPVVLGAHMVARIQSVVSREVAAQQAAVVTVATFHAGLKENIIIPSTADFTVNVRTLDPDVRARASLPCAWQPTWRPRGRRDRSSRSSTASRCSPTTRRRLRGWSLRCREPSVRGTSPHAAPGDGQRYAGVLVLRRPRPGGRPRRRSRPVEPLPGIRAGAGVDPAHRSRRGLHCHHVSCRDPACQTQPVRF